ncbi:hypothetical protein [Bifidobacterium castoris]|nr:hypothetical protein [Bifidobacterium castoris]
MTRRHGGDEWFDDPTRRREPDPDRQFLRLVARNTNKWRWVQVATLILALYAAFTVSGLPSQPASTGPVVQLAPAGKAAAYSMVDTWLRDGQPLGAQAAIMSWDGSDEVTITSQDKPVSAVAHHFTVTDGDRWWTVTETVRADGTAIGYPNVTPVTVPATVSPNTQEAWDGVLKTATVTDALDALVTQWAQAVMGSDADRLKVVMSDPDPAARYQPMLLDGVVKSATVHKLMYADRGSVDRERNTSDRAYARVSVTLDRSGTAKDAGQCSYGFDLLIADPDGTPHITAWGAPGTAPTLEDWSNRWEGAELRVPDGKDQEPEPSAGAAASTTS